ncbi:MAG: hypothetical protein MUD01_00910 [Chloroflexaceae bacterium]|jgi:signal transduction histidine kinase|nr:hypothetical protein [Chloroflexaceae bacterium]
MRLELLLLVDWALIAVSFFNTIAMTWLGLTVLLNAERRRWGTWLAGGGLLLSGLFFAGHSALVGRNLFTVTNETEFWWRTGWLLFVAGPFLWYLVMAWYSNVLTTRMHRVWLVVASLLGLTGLALLFSNTIIPSYRDLVRGTPGTILTVGVMPVAALVYPVFSLLCIVLALSALRSPQASDRFLGDVARLRARPWLIGASLLLLLLGLAVGLVAGLVLYSVRFQRLNLVSLEFVALLIAFDLFASALIAVVIILLGRAVASYELFTGKPLPSGGLFREWRRSLILAAGYGTVVGWSLSGFGPEVPPIFTLVLATMLMTVFFALLSWRTFAERERSIVSLRPFVASQQLYPRLLHPETPLETDPNGPFQALCGDVLRAERAYLMALGPLAALNGPGLAYPPGATLPRLPADLPARFATPHHILLPLNPAEAGGAIWAVPLWNERGLVGLLLLGPKQDDTLYTQEEMEIARATGERLLDTGASAELARRLMGLQRQRLAETQVLDRRTRRVLHDEVLPQLHAAILQIADCRLQIAEYNPAQSNLEAVQYTSDGNLESPLSTLQSQLIATHRQIADLLHDMPATAAADVARLGPVAALQRAVNLELASAFDRVTWHVPPDVQAATDSISSLHAEVLFYAARESIRNAARYGRNGDGGRPLHLTVTAARTDDNLGLTIHDDGVGLGASQVAAGGSGQGLALHSTMMAVIGGALTVESQPNQFTRVTLTVPVGKRET